MTTPPSWNPQPCAADGDGAPPCNQPMQFCQTGTSTAPVEHPGRQYDITLPINPGFGVDSLLVDAVTSPAGITWEVDDPDGERFRTDLTAFLESRLPPAAVVTITNPNAGVQQVCGAAAPMQIHIECLRLDQNPPNLVELIYNGGQDLIQNPAYNEFPALNPPVSQGDYGFRLLSRQDDPGPFPINQPANDALCTSVANRGWETNDVGRTFEIWGRDIVATSNVTPTPRGTPVQEMTSDGPPNTPGARSTIWQTFQVPNSGNFVIRVVHGARDPGENHRITLDNGDTDDLQNGDLIDDITNPASVTSNGGPNPWTQFNQTIPLVGGSTYTLALSTTNPFGPNRGGLFTDMRAFLDRPGQRATAVTDDETCVVTVDETTNTTTCTFWQPLCTDGEITSWRRVDNGMTLTNTEFWAQVPTPQCCLPEAAEGGGGGAINANLAVSDVVCATVGGIQQNAVRQVVLDPSGGQLSQLFLTTDGQSITPDTWTPGPCTTQRVLADQVLCDVDPGTGNTVAFLRKYVQTWSPLTGSQVTEVRDFNLSGVGQYTVTGSVRDCTQSVPGAEREILCDTDPVTGNTTTFLRTYITRNGAQTGTLDTLPDGSTAYNPTGVVGNCDQTADPVSTTGLCLADGTPIAIVTRRDSVTGTVTQDGWVNLTTGAFTSGPPPAGTIACGRSQSIQVTGVFCDVDANGDVINLVLIEYEYGPDGTIVNVRLVDATTGNTYVPTGTITVCPTGTDTAPEQDLEILCDVNGGVSTPFIRDYRRDENGAIVGVSNYTLAGASYNPTGTVRLCATGSDIETMVLCDVPLSLGLVNTFWRTWVYNPDGSVASVIDRDQDGNPYVVSPGGLVTDCGGIDSEQTVLCDVSGAGVATQFLRTEVRQANTILRRVDTALDGISPYTPTGTVRLCAGSDAESVILCDSATPTPNRFIRTYTYNASGAVSGFTDTTLAGTAFTPTGAVGLCTQPTATDFDFAEEVLCDTAANGTVTQFIRRFTFNSATGAVTTTTNTTLAGAVYNPTGTVALCSDCCPQVIGEGCTNTGSGRYTAIRATNGTITLIDSVSGATVAQGNIIPCPTDDTVRTIEARIFNVVPGTPWTPAQATGTITSVTATGILGTWSVTAPEGPAVTLLPQGYTATWEAEDDNVLQPPTTITADAASRVIVIWTER